MKLKKVHYQEIADLAAGIIQGIKSEHKVHSNPLDEVIYIRGCVALSRIGEMALEIIKGEEREFSQEDKCLIFDIISMAKMTPMPVTKEALEIYDILKEDPFIKKRLEILDELKKNDIQGNKSLEDSLDTIFTEASEKYRA